MQRNKQVAMGRKKFNMDPKKVSIKQTRAGFPKASQHQHHLHSIQTKCTKEDLSATMRLGIPAQGYSHLTLRGPDPAGSVLTDHYSTHLVSQV